MQQSNVPQQKASGERPLFIDIDKVLKERQKDNPALRFIPRFLVNYIKKTIHQDDLNYYLDEFRNDYGSDFVDRSTKAFNITSRFVGLENVPNKQGRYIFAANHPIGSWDGMIFARDMNREFGESKIMVNDLLMKIPNLSPFFMGVNLYGQNSRQLIQELDNIFESSTHVLLFPAGLVSRRTKGVIKDSDWKGTFIKRAVKHRRDIVPVHISGRLSNFFYNVTNVRKFFGIKSNLELIYLPDELFSMRDEEIRLTIGKPIPYTVFDKRFSHDDWGNMVRDHMYRLADNPSAEFGY